MLNLQFSFKCPILDSLWRPQLKHTPTWASGQTVFGSTWFLGWIPRLESEGCPGTWCQLSNTLSFCRQHSPASSVSPSPCAFNPGGLSDPIGGQHVLLPRHTTGYKPHCNGWLCDMYFTPDTSHSLRPLWMQKTTHYTAQSSHLPYCYCKKTSL